MKKQTRGVGAYLVLAVLLILSIIYLPGLIRRGQSVTEATFMKDLEAGNITEIDITQNKEVPTGSLIYTTKEDKTAVLNIREDLMPQFKIGGTFKADVPALDKKDIEFRIYYISPLGSFATWKSTKQTGSYDMQTFEIHARPVQAVEGLRPGMSVLLTHADR